MSIKIFIIFIFYFIYNIEAQKLLVLFLDGFRWDYIINRYDLLGFNYLKNEGGYVEKISPVFPADCHPNIYSIFTGLYPKHHGVVSNKVYDKRLKIEFDHDSPIHRRQIQKWVNAKPLWVTVKEKKKKSIIYHLPICEHSFGYLSPTYCVPYDKKYMSLNNFNQSVFEALNLLKYGNVDLAVVYNDAIDSYTHKYGPDSNHLNYQLLPSIDWILRWIILQIKQHPTVHLVVLSDHGMAQISKQRQIYLESILLPSQIHHIINQGGFAAIWPKQGFFKEVYFRLLRSNDGNFSVYTQRNIPKHWNVHGHNLSPPLLMIGKPGFFISSKELPFPEWEDSYDSGWHGYSPDDLMMSTPLLAYGHKVRRGSYLRSAHVTHSYALLSHLLDMDLDSSRSNSTGDSQLEPNNNNDNPIIRAFVQSNHNRFAEQNQLSPSSVVAGSNCYCTVFVYNNWILTIVFCFSSLIYIFSY